MVNQILRKSKLLRTKEGYSSIYISPDRTAEERKAFKKRLKEQHSKSQNGKQALVELTTSRTISS